MQALPFGDGVCGINHFYLENPLQRQSDLGAEMLAAREEPVTGNSMCRRLSVVTAAEPPYDRVLGSAVDVAVQLRIYNQFNFLTGVFDLPCVAVDLFSATFWV